jgi:hypothetical protein
VDREGSYLIPRIRNGSIKRLPINLKMISIENPMIRKGNNISQIKGNRNRSAIAKGQQSTNRMHQRIRVSNVFMKMDNKLLSTDQKYSQFWNFDFLLKQAERNMTIFSCEHDTDQKRTQFLVII